MGQAGLMYQIKDIWDYSWYGTGSDGYPQARTALRLHEFRVVWA